MSERRESEPRSNESATSESAAIKERLTANADQLKDVLLPEGKNIWVHKTTRDLAASVLERGLHVGPTVESIDHTASALELYGVPQQDGGYRYKDRDTVVAKNIERLSQAHRGSDVAIVLEFPELTREQNERVVEARENGESMDSSHFFITRVGDRSNIVEPKYVKGYVDLSTGKFVSAFEALKRQPT